MINIASVFLFIEYMNAYWRDSNAVIYIVLSIFTDLKLERIIGDRSTLLADLNLEIIRIWLSRTLRLNFSVINYFHFIYYRAHSYIRRNL